MKFSDYLNGLKESLEKEIDTIIDINTKMLKKAELAYTVRLLDLISKGYLIDSISIV